jgi:phosphatidylglycerol:prolipoprotein diacylglycerol transferase
LKILYIFAIDSAVGRDSHARSTLQPELSHHYPPTPSIASESRVTYDSARTSAANRSAALSGTEKGTKIHFPLYLHLGPFSVHPHVFFEALAYTIGFLAFRRLRGGTGDAVSDSTRWTVVAAAVAGAAIGSRVLYWFEDPAQTLAHWHDLVYLMDGKTIVGGLIGGIFAVELAKRLIGEKRSTGDLFAAPLALGIAIGRIGCFLTGLADHTYGTPTSLPWGVDFGDGIPRHPTQLYESVFALVLFTFLWRMTRRTHASGDAFKVFMVSYMSWRLVIDYLKPEARIAGLSGIQWACVAMLLYYGGDIRRWILDRGTGVADMPARSVDSAGN